MQLYNPFMPYRYLHPRASGLIAYKGGSGASAEQVDASVQGGVTAVNDNTNAGFADAAVVGETITNNQGTMLDNQANLSTGQSDIRADIAAIPQTTVVSQSVDTSGIENRIGSLEGTTNTGFANVGGRLDTVNSTLGNVQGSVDTGFAGVNDSLNTMGSNITAAGNKVSDLSDNVNVQFGNTNEAINNLGTATGEGFYALNDNVNTGFASQADTLGTMSTDILSGQSNINSLLDTIGNNQNTYYGGLAQGQQEILGGVGGIQDTFGQFQNQYNDDTTLANQSRARMEDTVTGGFNVMRDDMANTADAASRERMNIEGAVAQGAAATQDQQQSIQTDFGRTLKAIASDMPAQSQQDAASREDILNRLDTVRNVLATQGDNIDGSIREQYTKLANSFDQNGKLIQESVDQAGNTTRRQMDAQNNLLMATFNNTGQILDQSALNVNQLLGAMDNLGYTGSGRQPGDLSPQILANRPAAVRSGLMERDDPFFSTFG